MYLSRIGFGLLLVLICASTTLTPSLTLLLGWSKAMAQSTQEIPVSLGNYADWSVWAITEKELKICYISSEPKKRDPWQIDDERQGRPAVIVGREVDPLAVEPDPVVFEAIVVQTGYRFDDESTVRVTLGEAQYELLTDGVEAGTRLEEDWAARREAATAVVEQMHRHEAMVIEGISETGLRSRDSYSLMGFSRAYQTMVQECPD